MSNFWQGFFFGVNCLGILTSPFPLNILNASGAACGLFYYFNEKPQTDDNYNDTKRDDMDHM